MGEETVMIGRRECGERKDQRKGKKKKDTHTYINRKGEMAPYARGNGEHK